MGNSFKHLLGKLRWVSLEKRVLDESGQKVNFIEYWSPTEHYIEIDGKRIDLPNVRPLPFYTMGMAEQNKRAK